MRVKIYSKEIPEKVAATDDEPAREIPVRIEWDGIKIPTGVALVRSDKVVVGYATVERDGDALYAEITAAVPEETVEELNQKRREKRQEALSLDEINDMVNQYASRIAGRFARPVLLNDKSRPPKKGENYQGVTVSGVIMQPDCKDDDTLKVVDISQLSLNIKEPEEEADSK